MLPFLVLLGLSLGVSLVLEISGPSDEDNTVDDQNKNTADHGEDLESTDVGKLIDASTFLDEDSQTNIDDTIDLSGFDEDFLKERNIQQGSAGTDTLNGHDGDTKNSLDHLFGGDGDDFLVGGIGDVLVGGSGHDVFEVQGQGETFILDMENDEQLIVRYSGIVPEITGDGTDDGTSILANGYPIAHLEGVFDFDFSQIKLLPMENYLS